MSEINERQKWPENKNRYDFNYLNIFGFCQQFLCPKNHCCYRYQERVGRNNITWIPKQTDYTACSFFKPANCYFCSQKGYFEDKDAKGKIIKTTCMFCKGKKKLYPEGE